MTKRTAKAQTKKDYVDEVLSRVDPLHAAVMILGGTAAAYGITPPMTALLMAFSGQGGPVGDLWHLITTPGYQLLEEWHQKLWNEAPDPQRAKGQARELAAFCAGAVEAAIMYALVSNPETLKTMLAIPGQAMTGVGKLASFIPK